jgi:thiol-disulfide isomerase/thioredoxin
MGVVLPSLALLAVVSAAEASPAEVRVVEYLRRHVKPGREVVVAQLYNEVFTAPEERAVLGRLFDGFFKLPLFLAQYRKAAGRPPTLAEIAEQFRFHVPGQADVMLRILESDPRLPRFLTRNAATGEIESLEVDAILADPRFAAAADRTLAGLEGRAAPPFSIASFAGGSVGSDTLTGRPHVLYFWFSHCPPCVRTAPVLVELYEAYRAKGLEILGVNADAVLEVPVDDAGRAAYAQRAGIRFPLAHLTPEMHAAYGQVSVFPTLVFVDRKGTVVRQLVSAQTRGAIEEGIVLALR